MFPAASTEVTVSVSGVVALPPNTTASVPYVAGPAAAVSPCKALIVADEVTVVVDVVPTALLPPVKAWAEIEIVFTTPPVVLALKPETKFSVLCVPLRTLRPLNEAPLTASVSCWLSEASEVLTSPISAPGFCASVSALAIELSVVMTELIAEVAVASTDCPSDNASLEAVTMPLSLLSCAAIDQ